MARNPERTLIALVLRSVCRQMSSGVFAILGQKDIATTDIVRSFTSTFHMPFITPSLVPPRLRDALSYELHVRPDPTPAIVDIIRHFRWRHIHYLYDSDEGREAGLCLGFFVVQFRLLLCDC